METNELKLFDSVNVADAFKIAYINNQYRNEKIMNSIQDFQQFIKSLNDATILAPIIKEFLDTSINNDKILLEMSKIVQRMNYTFENNGNSFNDIMNLTAEDLEILDKKMNDRVEQITEKNIDKINNIEYAGI